MVKEARWWHKLEEEGRIQCDLCPRRCRLREGQRAFCFVRQNRGGKMVLTTYGQSIGFQLDPIEKKPLYHFHPGTQILSFGTAGCNLGCRFCQNWSISKAREIESVSEHAGPEEIAEAARRLGCPSVAFTYNDPVIWAEYAIDTARACRRRGLKTVAVTAGYILPQAREEFYSVLDAVNIDLKAFTEQFYHKLCFAHLAPVLDTLKWVKEHTDVWLEVTNLVIPGQNDSPEEVEQMARWILGNLGPDVPLHFTAFHPDFMMLDTPPTPPATLSRAREQARALGLHHVYTGNVHDPEGQTTSCPGCGAHLIARSGYRIDAYRLVDGACPVCATEIAGRFSGPPSQGASRFPRALRLS